MWLVVGDGRGSACMISDVEGTYIRGITIGILTEKGEPPMVDTEAQNVAGVDSAYSYRLLNKFLPF